MNQADLSLLCIAGPYSQKNKLVEGMVTLEGKREELIPKKHGNIPL